ncbi:MAG: 16S rRNA (guanine(527)-N(7))-methyltransferase RsmG [Candidatus Sulfotelmatobacter sp.]
MDPARIAELLAPFLASPPPASTAHHSSARGDEKVVLSPAQLHDISTYIDILQRWNARMNLTAIRDPEEIVTRHFGESLFAARHLFPRSAQVGTASAGHGASRGFVGAPEQAAEQGKKITVADIGSGAGFPGIPIKLWAPEISLTLIESNHKKTTFLREVARALTLTNIDIQNARAELLPQPSFDLVTLRAVERFETVLPTAAGLVLPRGCLALLIGTAQLPAASSLVPDLNWSEPVPIPSSRSRVLAIATKSALVLPMKRNQ